MINLRTSLTIERRSQLQIALKPGGGGALVVKPREHNQEYVTLVLGTVHKGEVINPSDVLNAARRLLDQVGELQ